MFFKRTLGQKIKSVRPSIFRIIIYFKDGANSSGTGFLFRKDNLVMTCAHVVVGTDKVLDLLLQLRAKPGNDTKDNKLLLEEFIKENVQSIKVETSEGIFSEATLKKIDDRYDIALIELESSAKSTPLLISNAMPDFGDEVFFCGFPADIGYKNTECPFAVNTGIVSAFPEITVTGTIKYKYIRVNSINLGGNSGAPLINVEKLNVVGMINGHMNHGADNVVFEVINNTTGQKENKTGSLRVPLNIAYATPITTIMHNNIDNLES